MVGESYLRRKHKSDSFILEPPKNQLKLVGSLLVSRKHVYTVLLFLSIMVVIGSSGKAVALPKVTEEKCAPSHKDYFIAQTAGYLGFVAMGIGREYQRHTVNGLLGYVPSEIGGVEIWQLSLKFDWHLFDLMPIGDPGQNFRLDPFYFGFSVTYGMHSNLFLDEPSQYPDDYYESTALRSTFNMGVAVQYKNKYTVFVEYAALDIGLVFFIRHPEFFMEHYDFLGLSGIGSLAAGFKMSFE